MIPALFVLSRAKLSLLPDANVVNVILVRFLRQLLEILIVWLRHGYADLNGKDQLLERRRSTVAVIRATYRNSVNVERIQSSSHRREYVWYSFTTSPM